MEFVRVRLKYRNCLTVDKIGRGSGLALLWFEDISLFISFYSSSHIDAMVQDGFGNLWRFTSFMVILQPLSILILGIYYVLYVIHGCGLSYVREFH